MLPLKESMEIPVVDASTAVFQGMDLVEGIKSMGMPVVIKNADFTRPTPQRQPNSGGEGAGFALSDAVSRFGTLRMPMRSARNFFVGDQGGEKVMGSSPSSWHPKGCSFAKVVETIADGPNYLSTRSRKGACTFGDRGLVYHQLEGEEAGGKASSTSAVKGGEGNSVEAEVEDDIMVNALSSAVPAPSGLLPRDKSFQVVYWLGSEGKNFGLHTDMFADQFIVQHEGQKKFLLTLPHDAAAIKPYRFLESPKFYKSSLRRVANLGLSCREVAEVVLSPGDVLYLPPWWWHEVQTVSPGTSFSATYRIHTEDSALFYGALGNIYSIFKNASAHPSDRLHKHLRSFFAYSMRTQEEEQATDRWAWGGRLAVGAAFGLGLAVGAGLAVVAGRS
jgi:hypothetical protein